MLLLFYHSLMYSTISCFQILKVLLVRIHQDDNFEYKCSDSRSKYEVEPINIDF